jgi:alpha-ketoglutarate-dependent taurine dioxygenase
VRTFAPDVGTVEGLCEWVAARQDEIGRAMLERGAVVLERTPIAAPAELGRVLGVLDEPLDYHGGIQARRRFGQVYESTPFPPEAHLLAHNEMPYRDRWPAWIGFACLVAAEVGGETTVADGRVIWERLSAGTRAAFTNRRLLYRDTFPASVRPGSLVVPWAQAFGSDDRGEVEAACRAAGLTAEWRGGALITSSVRPATAIHPRTGEIAWFNQVLQRNHGLVAKDPAVRRAFEWRRRELPDSFACSWEDGEPIGVEIVREIGEVVESVEVGWRWRRGDVLLVDNVLAVHGRRPYVGRREVVCGFTSGARL